MTTSVEVIFRVRDWLADELHLLPQELDLAPGRLLTAHGHSRQYEHRGVWVATVFVALPLPSQPLRAVVARTGEGDIHADITSAAEVEW